MAKFFIPPPSFAIVGGSVALPFKAQKSPPMTAAERQRRCRERGGGKHRGRRMTAAERRKMRFALYQKELEAAASAGDNATAIDTSPSPVASSVADWGISAMAA